MKGIELPIFHLNDQTETLQDLGINYDYTNCEVKLVTFYNIDALGIDINMGKEYGLLFSGGTTFTSSLTYDELKVKLSSHEKY